MPHKPAIIDKKKKFRQDQLDKFIKAMTNFDLIGRGDDLYNCLHVQCGAFQERGRTGEFKNFYNFKIRKSV